MTPSQGVGNPGIGQSVLAGLETGIVGGFCVAAYYALGSLLAGEGAWSVVVRLGDAVFREAAFSSSRTAAVVGFSILFVSTGSLGAGFAVLTRNAWAFQRVLLLGPAVGIFWYYVGFEILLPRIASGRPFVAPRQSLVVAHFLLGLSLSMYPRFLHALRRASGEPL
jgi:hypothetical protein